MDVEPLIRVRKNASSKADGCMPRKFAVTEQLGNSEWRREKVTVIVGWLSRLFRA